MATATAPRKRELSPLESLVLEGTLGTATRGNARSNTMERIQRLTSERQRLYAASASHPLLASVNGARIRALSAEIERLWEVLRRERAQRRARIERALQVVDEDDDSATKSEHSETETSSDATWYLRSSCPCSPR